MKEIFQISHMEIPAYITCKQPFSTDGPFGGQIGKLPKTLVAP